MAMSSHRKVLMCLADSWMYSFPSLFTLNPSTRKYAKVPTRTENSGSCLLGRKRLILEMRLRSFRMRYVSSQKKTRAISWMAQTRTRTEFAPLLESQG